MSAFRVFSVLSIFVAMSNALDKRQQTTGSRIIGGYRPPEHTLAKHIVSLNLWGRPNSHCCGGTIIAPDKILTAAHCIVGENDKTGYEKQPHDFQIIAGSPFRNHSDPKAQIIDIVKFSIHKGFYMKYIFINNDIAILHLARNIIEDGITAQRIPISWKRPADGTKCTALGWGLIAESGPLAAEVTYVDLDVTPNKMCRKHFTPWYFKIFNLHGIMFKKNVICVSDLSDEYSEKMLCDGDSGGPLFCDGVVAGVTSFGTPICNLVGGYTDIGRYYDWIQEQE